MKTMYSIAAGQPIPRDVEDYDGTLVAAQNLEIRLNEDDIWEVRGNEPGPFIEARDNSFVIGQRGGVCCIAPTMPV